jgi:hypothetical protein
MQQLRADSSLFDFVTAETSFAGPPEAYVVRICGRGLWQPEGSDRVQVREGHEILIRLGAAYPRMIPELVWRTPVFHPNISAHGAVCLGGYSTHWAPSLQLDELCVMLWDIVRYANYDANSPYNRAAAYWARTQTQFPLPIDPRPLRDRMTRVTGPCHSAASASISRAEAGGLPPGRVGADAAVVDAELVFVEDQIVTAEIVTTDPRAAAPRATAPRAADPRAEDGRESNRSSVLYIR